MRIAILLKSGPCTDEAGRGLQTAADMLAQGHSVTLYLLQEAVRLCQLRTECPNTAKIQDLMGKDLTVNVLTRDAELRGVDVAAAGLSVAEGSYESLVDLMSSCDRVVGIL
jgi:sulfur relay (sulfurtransferase) complex TusBCD TusD component (DsrE family)